MENKEHILIIMESLVGGGAEKVLVDLLNNFDYNKYNVELWLIYAKGIFLEQIPARVKVIELFKSKANFKFYTRLYKRINLKLPLQLKLNKIIKNKSFDCIISFLEGNSVLIHSFLFSYAKIHLSWVHIDMINHHWTKNKFYKNDEFKIYRLMDSIICVSRETQQQFIKRFNLSNTTVIYNPIDKKNIQKQALLYQDKLPIKKGFTICCVGSLLERKAFDRIIKVTSMLRQNGFNVYTNILGEGPKLKELLQLTKELNCENFINFLGFQNPPYHWINDSDIFVSVSKAEAFSLVIAEAMCLGKPIVSTTTAGPNELLDKNKYGLLVEHDTNSIYIAIKKLINDPQLIMHYAHQAKARAELFNLEHTMQQIYKIL